MSAGHGPSMGQLREPAAAAAIGAACKTLYLTGGAQVAGSMAAEVARQRLGYLAEVLTYECEERDNCSRARRIKEAKSRAANASKTWTWPRSLTCRRRP